MLLTCAGRRNYLFQYFRDALKGRGKVFTADLSPFAPAMLEAGKDTVSVPAVDDPIYFDTLLKACRAKKIKLLLSLNDFELPGLSRQVDRFRQAGIAVVVSPPEVVDLCFDKWATFHKLVALGIAAPATYLGLADAREALKDGTLSLPLIVKPRWGTASVCVERVEDEQELLLAYDWVSRKLAKMAAGGVGPPREERIVIQQALEGTEFGVDIVNDLNGRHRAVIVKRKLSMRAGETDRAVTVKEPILAALAAKIGKALGHRGLLDCDAFLTPAGPFILELNPRFGGGYPFSHAAGADVPAALLAWVEGKKAKPQWLRAKPGVVSAKCDRLVSAEIAAIENKFS